MTYFTSFKNSIAGISLPEKFTFPFYYDPHPLAVLASEELQAYLSKQSVFNHSFGLDTNTHEIGKMFGVLVVRDSNNDIGYLSAFSGNVPNQNSLENFVPPIYDILDANSFFRHDNNTLISLSSDIQDLKKDEQYISLQKIVADNNKKSEKVIRLEKEKLKSRKKNRKFRKAEATLLSNDLLNQLEQESLHDTFYLRELICYYDDKFMAQQELLNAFNKKIKDLKDLRNKKSNALHQKIFDQYSFLNNNGTSKSLHTIFKTLDLQAPAGTGDCAAPKLLQYAFLNKLTPIALAEFWWGKPGNSAIRKHGNFYASCKSKCEPILSHMLVGLYIDDNPLIQNVAIDKKIEFLFEDNDLLVINKPTELLSVPGKDIKDSVFSRLKDKFPESADFLIVHRLDMSTSGIMLIAKNKKSNQFLQSQFINRTIKKRYVALLDGLISDNDGIINLPLRVDLEDRPRQLVCYDYGKPASTKWSVINRGNGKTRIQFFPITGRTHQLRVHAAHVLGLNTAIVGDDLYGTKADRLHLHAAYIQFTHPTSKDVMTFDCKPSF